MLWKVARISAFYLLYLAFAFPLFAQNVDGTMGEWLSNGSIEMIVLEVEEIADFRDIPVDESFEAVPESLAPVKNAFSEREIKAVLVDVKVKNLSRRPLEFGHRKKQAGRGSFLLLSKDAQLQDSGNRNEFHENLASVGAVLSGRRLMNLGDSFFPETSLIPAGGDIRGKLLFLVPQEFQPKTLFLQDDSKRKRDIIVELKL